MELKDILLSIANGEHDESFDTIKEAIKGRKETLNGLKKMEMRVGSRVRVTDCSPKYLNGTMATIKKINSKKIVIV